MSPSEDPHASEDPPAESLKVPTSVDDTAEWQKLIDTLPSGPLEAAMSSVLDDMERDPREVGSSEFTAAAARKLDAAMEETRRLDQMAAEVESAGKTDSESRPRAASY